MSAMRKNAVDKTTGKMKNIFLFMEKPRAPNDVSAQAQNAINSINVHAPGGIRFHHAACV